MNDTMRIAAMPACAAARRSGGDRLAACAMMVLMALVACDSGTAHAQRLVQFRAAQIVTPAPVLTGDATDGRCAGSEAPCFKDNTDFTNGQRRMLRIEDIGIGALTHNDGETLDFFVGGKAATTSSGVSTVIGGALGGSLPTGTTSAPAVIGARLFNGDRDTMVTAVATIAGLSTVLEGLIGGPVPSPVGVGLPSGMSAKLMAATADFSGDGFDEVVFATQSSSGQLQVMYAKDPNDSNSAVFGPAITVSPMLAMAAGNFLGTGPMVVIAVAQPNGTLLLQYFVVNPVTRALSLQQSLTLNRLAGALPATSASIAVGRFNPPRSRRSGTTRC